MRIDRFRDYKLSQSIIYVVKFKLLLSVSNFHIIKYFIIKNKVTFCNHPSLHAISQFE